MEMEMKMENMGAMETIAAAMVTIMAATTRWRQQDKDIEMEMTMVSWVEWVEWK